MSRVWKETISPKQLNDFANVYHGEWMPQMDRCWMSDDGYQVTSRLLITEWGKVEHAAINRFKDENGQSVLNFDGAGEIPWAVKQEIKNEVFGEDRVAIEVFPAESKKVDVMDIYHLWVFPKNYALPFGIHPTKDKKCRVVNRGVPSNPAVLVDNYKELNNIED